jgi:hypothetical protein
MRTSSIAPSQMSETTVNSPQRPTSRDAASTTGWHNSDYPLQAQAVRIIMPSTRPASTAPSTNPAPQQQPAPVVSVKRRLVALVGVFMASLGTVGGLISMAALGPIGLAIAGGCLVGGLAIIGVSLKGK